MLFFRRYGILAILLLTVLAVTTVRCTDEKEVVPVQEEYIEDGSNEYDDFSNEESEIASEYPIKSEYPPPPYQNNQAGYTPQPGYLPPPINYAEGPAYQEQVYPQQPIYAPPPVYQPPVYNNHTVETYVPPVPVVPVVVPVPVPVYPAPVYSAQPAYQPPVANYSAPSYQPQVVVSNYSAPVYQQQSYQQPAYQAPAYQQNYQEVVVTSNYSTPQYQQQKYVAPISYQPVQYQKSNYSLQTQSFKYSLVDLAPFIAPFGYRANHYSLFYYRAAPYRQCPKNAYLASPSYRDIENAFAWAQQQLGTYGQGIQYMNGSQPSFAARHQVFSYLSQQGARLDEEGLLVELVSQYLADRACLTKWDKQRYLPQLTKLISVSNFPATHSCSNYYRNPWQGNLKYCVQSKYRTIDGFCNNPYHPYWGKSNVCHIRLLSPDYADGISAPRVSYNSRYPLPNPRVISNAIHQEVPLESPYNLMKMQWGQFINHDITNTGLSSYDGLVDCCKNPNVRGCWPIYVPPGDKFYGLYNVTCLNFIRSGVCPLCQLGPRQQLNKNTAFLDLSHVYGNTIEQANSLRAYRGGLLKTSVGKNGEILLPTVSNQEQCSGTCYVAGDSRVNQHPALTALHVLMVRNHNQHARALAVRHPNYNDELLYQEARRLNIAEYQMITYNEYLPIVFGPILSAYYRLYSQKTGYTYYDPKVDPTTWNEYATASCRFGHSQIQSTFGLYSQIFAYGQADLKQPTFRLKEWFMRPQLLGDGQLIPLMNGLMSRPSQVVDPWIVNDVRNHLYQSHKEVSGGDLAATNIWRGRDHGIPGYVHYIEYCFNVKVRGWKDLQLFIPYYALGQLRKHYKAVENIDLWTGGMAERHFPGADIGPTFACVNGIQYYHLKFGDRYFFEHGNQAGSFTPQQLDEIRRSTLARLLCRTAYLPNVPQYAFLQPSNYNALVNCSMTQELDYGLF